MGDYNAQAMCWKVKFSRAGFSPALPTPYRCPAHCRQLKAQNAKKSPLEGGFRGM